MNIGIIGSGISSLAAAYWLKKKGHRVTLFERNAYFGGHSHTVDVKAEGKTIPVDTGFLVHNDTTYPLLIQLFKELEIPICSSDMSFSVQIPDRGLEWSSENPFLQWKNLFSPAFLRMIRGILRFNRQATRLLEQPPVEDVSLGYWLKGQRYEDEFRDWYLIPMSAAIWSTPPEKMLDYPLIPFLRFLKNHGLLSVFGRLPWNTIPGGSRIYVERIIGQLDQAYLNLPIKGLSRKGEEVLLETNEGTHSFDLVISGVHAPDNLRFLKDASAEEKEVLSAFSYQPNRAVLHSDSSFLPKNRKGWVSWNYVSQEGEGPEEKLSVTYNINHLQPLDTSMPMLVTLNPHKEVDPRLVHRQLEYSHPLFDQAALDAQKRVEEIQGEGNLYFTGAWQRYGFHEDGIWSARRVIDMLEQEGRL